MIGISSIVKQSRPQGQDAIFIEETDEYTICFICDGAGGISGGLEASKLLCQLVSGVKNLKELDSSDDFELMLRNFDKELQDDPRSGESTGLILLIKDDYVVGASVGDSQCWLIEESFHYEITGFQYRKPLLGSGSATPVGFGPIEITGSIVAGSDGLFDYVNMKEIKQIILDTSGKQSIHELVEQAELCDSTLQDDIAIIVGKIN